MFQVGDFVVPNPYTLDTREYKSSQNMMREENIEYFEVSRVAGDRIDVFWNARYHGEFTNCTSRSFMFHEHPSPMRAMSLKVMRELQNVPAR